MKRITVLVALALTSISTAALAIVPETGLYWMPQYSGTAIYIEHQAGTVVVTVYAFNQETGEAEIYNSAGPLRDDGNGLDLGEPLSDEEGLYPHHQYVGDLYKVTHGQPLLGWQPGYSAHNEYVGTIALGFIWAGQLAYLISSNGSLDYNLGLERFDFSQGKYRFETQSGGHLMFDVLGEWVFVDLSDPEHPPYRFNFSEREPENPPMVLTTGQTFAVTFVDPDRDARFICAKLPEGDSGDPEQPQKRRGCELYVGDDLILSANLLDIGIDRIQAYRGALGPQARNPYRRPQTVIGIRVRHAETEPVGPTP